MNLYLVVTVLPNIAQVTFIVKAESEEAAGEIALSTAKRFDLSERGRWVRRVEKLELEDNKAIGIDWEEILYV